MNKYGYKQVLTFDEFQEGLIVECVNGKIVCREYKKNEYGERQRTDYEKEIDLIQVANKKTPIGQMREISKQLGRGDFAIDEEVIALIEELKD